MCTFICMATPCKCPPPILSMNYKHQWVLPCDNTANMWRVHVHAHVHILVTMEISVHSLENIPRYTADTVGSCDNLVYYLVMHTHMKPGSTVDTLWVLHETR